MTRSGFAAALLAFALPARAGVVLHYEDDQKKHSTVELDGKKVRTSDDSRDGSAFIFDGEKRLVYLVNGGDRTYQRMDEETGTAVAKRVNAAMEAAKAKMTPEQRAKMEAMMAGRQARSGREPVRDHTWRFERAPGGDKVAGYSCDNYRVIHDGEVESDGCFVPWQGGPLRKDDFQGFEEMGRFVDKTYGGMAQGFGQGARQRRSSALMTMVEASPGFPAVMRNLDDKGKPTREMRLVKLERTSLSASRFEPPAGYSEKPMMKGMGGE